MRALSNGCSIRGAQMGRSSSINNVETTDKFYMFKVPMTDGGAYDKWGAYWGIGEPLYFAYTDNDNDEEAVFVRATSRDRAKEQVREVFKNARFYR